MIVTGLCGVVEAFCCFLVIFSVVVDPAQGSHGSRVVMIAHLPSLFVVFCFVFMDIAQHAKQAWIFAVFLHQFVQNLHGFFFVILLDEDIDAFFQESSLLKELNGCQTKPDFHVFISQDQKVAQACLIRCRVEIVCILVSLLIVDEPQILELFNSSFCVFDSWELVE